MLTLVALSTSKKHHTASLSSTTVDWAEMTAAHVPTEVWEMILEQVLDMGVFFDTVCTQERWYNPRFWDRLV
jgi:hypothetical protein